MSENLGFTQLHNHSHYSFLDGFNSPKAIVERASDLGHKAVAITDHGNVHGLIEQFKASQEHDIKPIFGVEMYTCNDMNDKSDSHRNHIVLLAKNEKGLKNLYKLITLSNTEGFYYKPRIDFETLQEYSEGIIAMSACLAGAIPEALMDDNYQKAKEIADKYKDEFGNDFYLEIMANNMDDQYEVNKKLVELSEDIDINLVATCDVHYLDQEDAKAQDVMLCVQTGAQIDDDDRMRFDGNHYYFKTEQQMRNQLFDVDGYQDEIDEAISNTGKIAGKIDDIELDLGGLLLPEYETPEGETLESYLKKMVYEKLFEYALENDIDIEEYSERIERELEVINMKGFPGYFLIVQDYVRWAKDNGIVVGPGRGSAAGSLVSYLLDITAINPMEYGLLFERFLNPERTSMPDIDIDFSDRSKVIDYVIDKYGKENVASICNFGTLGAKMAIRDVGRALGIDYYTINEEISKKMPNGASLDEALEEVPELKTYQKKFPKLFEYTRKLEGKPRQLGTHASAVVITPEPVVEYVPKARTKNNQTGEVTYVTQTEMHDSEELGMLKMDFLGLNTITIIDKAIEFIHRRDDLDEFDFVPTSENIWDLPLDDEEVYENIFCEADTNGVFQVESHLFKDLLNKMQPQKFEDIIALLALGRPGPLEAGIVEDYFDCLHGDKEVEYPHPDLEDILEETYGYMVYQEQVMGVARKVADYSLGEADILRRGMGKKKPEVMKRQHKKFVEGTIEQGYSEEFAEEMFELIEYFAGYGFNKSHSASYSFIAYGCAYIKYYFPAEFYAALMTFEADKSSTNSKITNYFADCYKKGIEILPPDINESDEGFTAVDGKIRLGLTSIDGVGSKAIQEIIDKRPFDSLEDMYNSVKRRTVDKTVFNALIKSGAFDSFKDNRNQLLKDYQTLREFGQLRDGLFDDFNDVTTSKEEIIEMEMDTIKISISYPSEWDKCNSNDIIELEGYVEDFKETRTRKRNNLMCFCTLKTKKNSIKTVVFPDAYGPNHDLFQNGFKLKLKGKKDDENSFLISESDNIELLEGDLYESVS